MSFYIRKSIKFGPIRFNISKSGIGVSAGVKGARVATGPKGTYVHLGRNGVYYRQKIDGSVVNNESIAARDSRIPNNSYVSPESINLENLIESTNKDTISQINSRIEQPSYGLLIGILSTFLAGFTFLIGLPILNSLASLLKNAFPVFVFILFVGTAGIWVLGVWIAWVTNQQENLSRTTTLQYKLDDETSNQFIKVQNAFELFSKSLSIWQVISRTPTWDWKRNAGATSLIDRNRIKVGYMQPPFIQTQIKVCGFSLASFQLFFLPDQVLIYQNRKYGSIDDSSLCVSFSPTRFIEDGGVPQDSKIVDYTWRYVRKDGGPDRRFTNNRQLPVAQYGYIELTSQTGINLHFHISNLESAQQFTNALLSYIRYSQAPNASSASRESSRRSEYKNQAKSNETNKPTSSEETAYTILNVSNNASWEEISFAYKKLAHMYHPDKVVGLAPEYQEIAEKRMKSINASYEQLKLNHGK